MTRARELMDDGGYPDAVKEWLLRDKLVFGITSDKARRDAIAIGNDLTYQQVYNLAKTEEATAAQMSIISKGAQSADVHAVRSRPHKQQQQRGQGQGQRKSGYKTTNNITSKSNPEKGGKTCWGCGGSHAAGDTCPPKGTK